MPASQKTLYIAESSINRFFWKHKDVYYWTFTFADNVVDKGEAERRVKPLRDAFSRRGFEYFGVWERQTRGAWHLHMLVDHWLDVTKLRPWLVARGWGVQMRAEHVSKRSWYDPERGQWMHDANRENAVKRYLLKYLTKTFREEVDGKKKIVFSTRGAKSGTTRFKWHWSIHPGAYLYHYGRELFIEVNGRLPRWCDISDVIRFGVEAVDWLSVDPLWDG